MNDFRATAIAAEEWDEVNTFALVMAEEPEGGGKRVEIQKALSFDEQDRENGQDTYCVSTETGVAHYGGIAHWTLGTTELKLVFDPAAASVFGVREVSIQFFPEHRPTLEAGLARLFS